MASLLKNPNWENNPSVIFRPYMEDGSLREFWNTRGGEQQCFHDIKGARYYMSRNYGPGPRSWYYFSAKPSMKGQGGTEYEIWAFHVGRDESDLPYFPPTLVYKHKPKKK